MLEAIRKHSKTWIAKLILVLITVPFALWGIDSYFSGGGQTAAVASVGDAEISDREFQRALNTQRDDLQAKGGKVDINSPVFRKQVLDQLIDTHLIKSAAQRNGMMVSQAQISAMISSVPTFMENGAFSPARLESWLRNQGLSEAELIAMLQQDALLQQFQLGYGQGSVVASTSANLLAKQLVHQREVSEAVFSAQAFLPTIKIDDKTVEAEYNANKASFATPPQVRVQYLTVSMQTIADQIAIAEETARQYYESNKARYQEPEQRRASHILIKADAGMAPAAQAEAKAKADKLLVELRQNPARFADLAKQHSQDPGSAARGGDLGNFSRDMMVKPFSDAAFSMKPGELSAVVKSDFGYHIIRLESITPGAALGFAVVKDDIVRELKAQEAQRKYAEIADSFSNLVYEKPESLAPAAQALNLPLQESGWISQVQAEPALLKNPRLLAALFTPDALEKKQNTEAIEVGPSTLVAARVLEHRLASTRALAEVAGEIRQRLTLVAARAKAMEAGKAALAAAQAGQAPAGLGMPMQVSRMQSVSLPPQAVKAIFKAGTAKLPTYVGVEMPDGYRVYRISKVSEGEMKPGMDQQIQRDLGQLSAQEELRSYLEYIRARNPVKINEGVINNKAE